MSLPDVGEVGRPSWYKLNKMKRQMVRNEQCVVLISFILENCKLINNNNNYINFISRGQHIWHEYQSNIWSSITKVNMSLIIEQS